MEILRIVVMGTVGAGKTSFIRFYGPSCSDSYDVGHHPYRLGRSIVRDSNQGVSIWMWRPKASADTAAHLVGFLQNKRACSRCALSVSES